MALYSWFMEFDFTEKLLYGLAALFTVWFFVAVAMKVAKKHWFRDWAESGFTAVWLALIIRMTLVEAYSIPSESMVPTLLISDHLLVSKTTFGWHVPFTKGRFLRFRDVKRGEITIFVPPHAPKQSYVKRCVGLPGDTVEVRAKQVYINGQNAEVPYSIARLSIHNLSAEALPILKAEAEAFVGRSLPGVLDLQKRGLNQKAETLSRKTTWLGPVQTSAGDYYIEAALAGQVLYTRLIHQPRTGNLELMDKAQVMVGGGGQPNWTGDHHLGNRDWFGPYTLKPGEYWMMGDNRDNSLDSRFFGPIQEEALRGTPLLRYWPLDRLGLLK